LLLLAALLIGTVGVDELHRALGVEVAGAAETRQAVAVLGLDQRERVSLEQS